MSRRKIVLFGMAVFLMIVAAGFVINRVHSQAKYDIFKEHRELFKAAKNEAEHVMGNSNERGDIKNTFLYSSNEDQFHDNVSASLQEKIRQIAGLSEDKLSFVRYSKQEGKTFIRFVFDWERDYGDTYHIVYGESQDMVEKAYDEEPVAYVLHKLEDSWYGIGIK